MFFIGVSTMSYPFYLTPQVMHLPNHTPAPDRSYLLSFVYGYHVLYVSNTIPMKKRSLKKPFLFQNQTKNPSILNIKTFQFLSPYLIIESPLQCSPTISSSILSIFRLPISPPYILRKPCLQSQPPLPSSICQRLCTSLFDKKAIPIVSIKKPFHYVIHSANSDCVKGRENLVKVDTIFASSCLPERWTGVAVLAITDSLSRRLKKLVHCRQQPLMKTPGTRMTNHAFNHPLPYPQPIIITFTPC